MSTVARLLRARGSLATLGMNGFLARLLSFIDTNSAFLLGTEPIPDQNSISYHIRSLVVRLGSVKLNHRLSRRTTNPEIVNLERFIGLMTVVSQS